MWLAHPHLSNAIYESWYPLSRNNREERKSHLIDAVKDCLLHGGAPRNRMAPLWALARILKGSSRAPQLEERLEPDLGRETLGQLYLFMVANGPLPLSDLPVWVEVQALSPELRLEPDPTLSAITAVRMENLGETGLRLTCHKLLQNLGHLTEPLAKRAAAAILELLSDSLKLDWKEWVPVVWDALFRLQEPRLWRLIDAWARRHPRRAETSRLLRQALRVSNGESTSLSLAQELLRVAPADLAWSELGREILHHSKGKEIPVSVVEWTQRYHLEFAACYLLSELVPLLPRAQQWAREWAALWHQQPSANFILEALCRAHDPAGELRDWSIQWMRLARADVSFLLEWLLKIFSQDPEVRLVARQWLERVTAEHRSWAFVGRHSGRRSPMTLN